MMDEARTEQLRSTLFRWAEEAAALMTRWGLQAHDGYLGSQSVLALQGYSMEPEQGWDRSFELHLDRQRVPWEPAEDETEALEPPAEVSRPDAGGGAPMTLYSTQKYCLPITFLKPLELPEGGEIHLIAPKGVARVYIVDVIWLIERGADLTDKDDRQLRRSSGRLNDLAAYPWPRRDRWFAKFCTELRLIHDDILAGSPPRPSQMEKFGRRFSVV